LKHLELAIPVKRASRIILVYSANTNVTYKIMVGKSKNPSILQN
jgi:hypothetical protein